MSKSQVNYTNDNTVGKRYVLGSRGLNNKVYERIKTFGFQTVTMDSGTEDQIGYGDGALSVYYLSAVVNSATVKIYSATDEYKTALTLIETVTVAPFASPAGMVSSLDPNSGKVVLTTLGITTLLNKYVFAGYTYLVPNGGFEIERHIIDESVYIEDQGGGIHMRHNVGVPNSELDGNYRFDRFGSIADGSARNLGDVFIIRDRVTNDVFVAYGGMNILTDASYFREVIPLADSVMSSGEHYVKDASLYEGDVVTDVVTAVSSAMVGSKLQYTVTLTNNVFADNDLLLSFPYNAYLVCPAKSLALPVSDNVIVGGKDTIKIVPGFGGSTLANADVIYIRVNIPGGFIIRNSAL